jgi:predicted MFS family arabinose efflux permease
VSTAITRTQVLLAGVSSLLLTLGVARFAYTPLLPLMRAHAGLGVQQAGWLAAINYSGYLLGAILASLLKDIVVKDRLYRIGMVLAVLSTGLMAATSEFWLWALSRFVAGLTSAAGMLLGGALVLNWLARHGERRELGLYYSGVGLGIAGSAAIVALMTPALSWNVQWWVLTAVGAVLLLPALGWLPAADRTPFTKSGEQLLDRPPGNRFLAVLMAAYFCAGIGYVVSATFIVAIVDALPGLGGRGSLVFLWLGLGAAPSSALFDLLARRVGEVHALIIGALLQIVGILLPLLAHEVVLASLGALVFGASFVGIVSLVLSMAGRYYPTRPAKMMGRMTIAYGTAQILGPAITASLAVHFGGYSIGLYVAALSMGVATLLLFWLRQIERSAFGLAA